ncbi:hypothetical protein JCM11251_001241 [Rhodosporidiobolus azoricus]
MAMSPDPSQLPSLAPFLSHFTSLVSSPSPPPSIFIHSPTPSPVLVSTILGILSRLTSASYPIVQTEPPSVEALLPKVAHLDLADVHSVKSLFDRVLDQLSGWRAAGEEKWEGRNGGVEAWDGRMDGVKVVEAARPGKRKGTGADARRGKKRARLGLDRDEEDEDYHEEEDAVEDDTSSPETEETEWILEWDRSATSEAENPPLQPLRNTVESFQHSLGVISSFSASSISTSSISSATSAPNPLDPASDLLPPSPAEPNSRETARRFIVLERGELLSELAGGAGAVGGAARETGAGLTFASTMHRLGELTSLPITLVLISRIPWRKSRDQMVGLPSPTLLTTDVLSDNDEVALLTSRFASSPLAAPAGERGRNRDQLIELFRSLATVVKSSFSKILPPGEEDDLAYLCAKFWPVWKETVEKSNPPIAPTDTARLSIALKSTFSAELDRLSLPRQSLMPLTTLPSDSSVLLDNPVPAASAVLQGFAGTIAALPRQPTYLAAVPPTPEKNGGSGNFFSSASSSAQATPTRSTDPNDPFSISSSAAAGPSSTPLRQQALPASSSASSSLLFTSTSATTAKKINPHLSLASSLPILARYLLIAAYFAASNPPKSDVRMFVKVDEMEGVAKKGKKTRKGARKPGASPSKAAKPASLYGGKSFPYERLVAIFEAIVDDRREYTLGSVGVAGQVLTLLHLRLLTLSSASLTNPDKVLDGVKLKCPLSKDVVEALALSVGWKEWRERVVAEE